MGYPTTSKVHPIIKITLLKWGGGGGSRKIHETMDCGSVSLLLGNFNIIPEVSLDTSRIPGNVADGIFTKTLLL